MASCELICVPPAKVDALWPHARKFIENAVIRGDSDYSLDYIRRRLEKRRSLLWLVVKDETKIVGAGTTEICSMIGTNKRVCVITAFGADDLDHCIHLWDRIKRYAREEKCELIRIYGRHGWLRRLQELGFTQPWIALEMKVD